MGRSRRINFTNPKPNQLRDELERRRKTINLTDPQTNHRCLVYIEGRFRHVKLVKLTKKFNNVRV
jgi:hypothetical protein